MHPDQLHPIKTQGTGLEGGVAQENPSAGNVALNSLCLLCYFILGIRYPGVGVLPGVPTGTGVKPKVPGICPLLNAPISFSRAEGQCLPMAMFPLTGTSMIFHSPLPLISCCEISCPPGLALVLLLKHHPCLHADTFCTFSCQ